jgi:hypothetical protein
MGTGGDGISSGKFAACSNGAARRSPPWFKFVSFAATMARFPKRAM